MINHKENILKLKDGESYFIDMGEESGGEIWKKHEWYFLFQIPQYGGYPMFDDVYNTHQIEDMINSVLKWT